MEKNNTINGRTPEEIKKGLECCKPKWKSDHWVTCRDECPFRNEHAFCRNVLMSCVSLIIQQLERERDEARNDLDTINYANTELHSAYEAMKRERDAAVLDLEMCCPCEVCIRSCKYDKVNAYSECADFEWRGVQEVE